MEEICLEVVGVRVSFRLRVCEHFLNPIQNSAVARLILEKFNPLFGAAVIRYRNPTGCLVNIHFSMLPPVITLLV